MIPFEAKIHIAAFSNEQCIRKRIRHFGEEFAHLKRRAQEVRVIGHAHAVWVCQRGVGLDRQQYILQFRIRLIDVMHIVGGDKACRVPRAE